MTSPKAIGAGSIDLPALANAFTTAAELANTANGTTPGLNVPTNEVVPIAKISTLANIVSSCINSSGGAAGDSSPCGLLFSLTPSSNGLTLSDTTHALLNLANDPTRNVDLNPAISVFQPELPTAPPDWKIQVPTIPAAPTFSPAPGSYSASIAVTLADTAPSAAIYYTTDGSEPSTSSSPYAGAFTVSITTIVKAVAVTAGIHSIFAAATYTLPAPRLVFVTQPVSGLAGSTLSPPLSVAIATSNGSVDTAANVPITVQIGNNPGGATLSGTTTFTAPKGIATFSGLAISTQGNGYTLTASCNGDSSVTSSPFNLTNLLTLSLPPAPATIGVPNTASFTLEAPAGGLVATVQSSNTFVATVSPTAVAIPQGATSGTFVYTGLAPGSVTLTVTLPGAQPASATAEVAGTLSISITPATVTLRPLQTQVFTTAISNSANPAVTWTLSPSVGSLSAAGIYTTPASISTAQTVTVKATSVADPAKSVTGIISLSPPVSVSITPATLTLGLAQTQPFTATVANNSNTAVTWTLSPAMGNITADGLYTAPSTMPASASVIITATSVSDPTKSASAIITIVPPEATGYGLAWQDTFDKLNLCSTNRAGCNWYNPGIWNYSTDGAISDPSGTYVNLNWQKTQGSNYTNMTTASMDGTSSRAWTLGYIEISMAFNPVMGNWPALWMLPLNWNQSMGANYSDDLPYGEIDLFEWFSDHPALGYSTVHVWDNNRDVATNEHTNTWPLPPGTILSGFNTYGVLWTPTTISWYFNNRLVETFSTTAAPFNAVFAGEQPYALILSEQSGCDGIYGVCSDATLSSPLDMQVQWVHVYSPPPAALTSSPPD
jgi:beta-glucanase (GH16 family)